LNGEKRGGGERPGQVFRGPGGRRGGGRVLRSRKGKGVTCPSYLLLFDEKKGGGGRVTASLIATEKGGEKPFLFTQLLFSFGKNKRRATVQSVAKGEGSQFTLLLLKKRGSMEKERRGNAVSPKFVSAFSKGVGKASALSRRRKGGNYCPSSEKKKKGEKKGRSIS